MKIDWKRKLSSRKFWCAVAAFVAGLIIALGGQEGVASTVSGCIMSAGAVVAYIFAEGMTDAKGYALQQDEQKDDEDDESELLLLTDDEEDTSSE